MKKILSISLLFTIIFNLLLFASAADEYGAGIYTKSLYSDTYTAFVRGFGEDKDNVFLAIKKQRPQNEDIIAAAKEYLPDSNNAVSYFRLDGYDKETNDFVPLREVPKLKIMITVPFNGYFKHMGKDYKVLHYEDGKITELEIVERETNTAKVTFLSDKLGYFILSYNTKYLDFTFWFDEDMDAVYKKIENVSNYYEIEFPEPPEKKGYIFDGWWYYYPPNPHYTVELEEGTLLRDLGRGAFARWKKISETAPLTSVEYTVTFVTDEGMLVEEQTVEENTCASEPQAPTRDGFEFAGWYTDKELNEKYDFDTPVTAKTYLYAAWKSVNDTEKDTHVSDNAETNNTDKITSDNQIIFTIDKTEYTVFGISKQMDVSPKIVNNLTMLPARYVAEALGATVEWNDGTVTITKGNTVIEICIGKETATINGEEITLLSPAFIETDRTYCPVRFICESLGADVDWDEENRVVTITKK